MSLGQVEQTPAAAQSGGELEGEGQEGLLRSGAVGGRRQAGRPTWEWGGAPAGWSSQVSLPVRPVRSGARLVSSNRTARREGRRATQVDATANATAAGGLREERGKGARSKVTLTGRQAEIVRTR